MTIDELMRQYQHILAFLNQRWPVTDDQKVFTRTMKVVEELGELSDAILSSKGLQRESKLLEFEDHHLEEEFADVLGSLLLLAAELNIDVEKVITEKIQFTKQRLEIPE
jgi:NTP pyrophosphatase (non-canonical NTP hydrolase)